MSLEYPCIYHYGDGLCRYGGKDPANICVYGPCPHETPSNDPLTLDELREMVGCWVWVIVTYQHEGKTFQCDGWALVETPARIAYLDQEFQLTELGTRFHAYRHQVSDFRVRFAPNEP